MKLYLFVIIVLCWGHLQAHAQTEDVPYVSWDYFVQNYLETLDATNEDETFDEDLIERLENLSLHPFQINLLQRTDLLQLPFVDEVQADSILSYRNKRHGFVSLGELQLIKGIDYYTRAYLSLFVRCDSVMPPSSEWLHRQREEQKLIKKLLDGKHEVESRLDIPLYQRAGYEKQEKPTATNCYTGNALHHVVRYMYHYKREVLYGLTLEKDAGEPIFKKGFYPYDYISGYILLKLKNSPWSVALGDYNVYAGRGLLLGQQLYGGRIEQQRILQRPAITFKVHTSTQESHHFRGVAASFTHSSFTLLGYVSYQKLDGRFNNLSTDTISTLLTTGLHRTFSELYAHRTLGCLTSGASVTYNRQHFALAAHAVYTHYTHVVSPQQRIYNQYYFRGQEALASSLSYYYLLRNFTATGEWAIDGWGHMAVENTFLYKHSRKLAFSLQQRHFSPRFISINGRAMQQGSKVANEQGIMLSTRYWPLQRLEIDAYIDCFRFPRPTFNAYFNGTHGVEAMLQSTYACSNSCKLLLRYQVKQKQYNFTYKKQRMIENRVTQKLRLASLWTHRAYDCTLQADASYVRRQSGTQHWGTMLSVRGGYKVLKGLQVKGMLGLFFTDDYESRLYVYEPQLLHAAGFSSFSDYGWRSVLLTNWNCVKSLTLSLRFSTLNYFNRNSISSGTEQINSAWKNDLSLQVRWTI